MELFIALEALSSLSQETRLRVFRLLVEYGADGANPSQIAEELKMPDNTLSFHLSHMSKAGLVTSTKNGRSVTYFANQEIIENLIEFLQESCCARESKPRATTKKNVRNERKC